MHCKVTFHVSCEDRLQPARWITSFAPQQICLHHEKSALSNRRTSLQLWVYMWLPIAFSVWWMSALFHVVNTLVMSRASVCRWWACLAYGSSRLPFPKNHEELIGSHWNQSQLPFENLSLPTLVSLTRLFEWIWLLNAMSSAENRRSLCSSLFDWMRSRGIQ